MSCARLEARVAGARSLGSARIAAMRLAFNKPGRDGTGKANLVVEQEASAWGVVHALPSDSLAILDRFEPGYVRVEREVRLIDGRALVASTYLWEARTPELSPSDEYLGHLLTGAREHALPSSWIDSLEARLGA